MSLTWLVRRDVATGKSQYGLRICSQRQYCVLSEDRHRLVVIRDLDL